MPEFGLEFREEKSGWKAWTILSSASTIASPSSTVYSSSSTISPLSTVSSSSSTTSSPSSTIAAPSSTVYSPSTTVSSSSTISTPSMTVYSPSAYPEVIVGGGPGHLTMTPSLASTPPLHASVTDINIIMRGDPAASTLDVGEQNGDPRDLNDLNVVESYEPHLRQNPRKFIRQILAIWSSQGWRGYSDYIGPRVLEPGQSQNIAKIVLTSNNVQHRIKTLAKMRTENLFPQHTIDSQSSSQRRGELQTAKDQLRRKLEEQLNDVAQSQINNSVARLDSLPSWQLTAATFKQILTRIYHRGIHINVPQVLELRRLAQYAAEQKQSIIFLPCHKSHIDYLTLVWLLFRIGISLPFVVAGDNLNIPIMGDMFRGAGAFFIRRTFAGDHLYPVVIREYIEQLLSEGKNMECFIEGTRSRTGKLLPPKLGILRYIVDALQAGRTKDCWICPISVQYDSVVESETYVTELLGKPKEKESLMNLLSGSSALSLQLGRIDVRFQKPWSLKGFIDEQSEKRRNQFNRDTANHQTVDFTNNNQNKNLLLKSLGYRIMGDINRTSVVMPTALVGTVLLTLRGRGVGRSALERKVQWLRDAIVEKGYQVADFGGMSVSEVVEGALEFLKDLVEIQRDVMEVTILPAKRFELSYYRNQVIHVFVEESILCASCYPRIKQGGTTALMQTMTHAEILREATFISGILRNEFIFGTSGLETNVNRTIASLIQSEVLEETLVDMGNGRQENRIGLHRLERERGRDTFDSFLFLIWPFIESYWLACCSLLLLAPPREQFERPLKGGDGNSGQREILWFSANAFEKKAQLFGKTLFQQGEIIHFEAINAATLSQAFGRMEELGFILRRKSDSVKPIPLIAISPEFTPLYDFPSPTSSSSTSNTSISTSTSTSTSPSSPLPYPHPRPGSIPRLWDFLERLSSFRREGKERRETSASQQLIMSHVMNDDSRIVERTWIMVDKDGHEEKKKKMRREEASSRL